MMSRNEIQDRFEWLGLTRIIVYLCVLRLKLYYFINIVVCLLKVTFPSKKKKTVTLSGLQVPIALHKT